jgi:hypothetical protein
VHSVDRRNKTPFLEMPFYPGILLASDNEKGSFRCPAMQFAIIYDKRFLRDF